MAYEFIESKKALDKTILEINNLKMKDLDVSKFKLSINQECLNQFKEKILEYKSLPFFIVGDYDVDGIFSTTIITRLLTKLRIAHNFYIPSRVKDGYGVNKNIIDNALKYDFKVLLLLDNGVAAKEEIEYAKKNGLKVLVIDHHEYEGNINVDALIHPNLLDCEYDDACTGGLSLLLSNCFYKDELNEILGGVASLADMVKVLGYNRYIIKNALRLLNTGHFYDFNKLSKKDKYTYDDLSYVVIPKINAISRLDKNANKMVYYFGMDAKSQNAFANTLEDLNNERKELTQQMTNMAKGLIDENASMYLVNDDSFKEGLCGLVATRICFEKKKPALVLAHVDGLYKGSGRSDDEEGIYEYLLPIKDIFETFGGHSNAVGLSISEDNYPKLVEYLNNNPYKANTLKKMAIKLPLKDLNLKTVEKLEALKPFGTGFKEPFLYIEDFIVTNSYLISRRFPKYILNEKYEAIYFKANSIETDFTKIVGHIQKDNYKKDDASLVVEELLYE